MANNNDEIVAAVSVRSKGGVSVFETTEDITLDNVGDFLSEASDIRDASNELAKLGFKVLQVSEASISIAGSRKLLQDVSGARLRKQKKEIFEGQEIEFFAAPGDPAEQVLQLPEDLTNLIEGVTLAEPPEFFESALPPIVPPHPDAYRYLFVPDEVGLVLNADRVHRLGTTGSGVKVAMPDSGFYRHPLYNRHGYRVSPTVLGPGATDPTQDTYGHGTGEAANVFAAAPDARLVPVKMGDALGSFIAAKAENPQIITNSWGYDIDRPPVTSVPPTLLPLLVEILTALLDNIVVCFAAGNGHKAWPASDPYVIAVGGVHVNYPDLDLEASSYASSFDSSINLGRHVPDLCGLVGRAIACENPPDNPKRRAPLIMLPIQPGCILDNDFAVSGPFVCTPDGTAPDDGWALFSGTSAACPQVAGVAALLLEKDPTLTPADVKEILINSATDVVVGNSAMGDPAGPGTDAATGAGLVNAKWAWLFTMSAVATQFFEAPADKQAEMLASGQMPRIRREVFDDLMETLRSR